MAAAPSPSAKSGDDTTVLLSMLHTEVERLKLTEKLQMEGIERVDRDNKRQAILLSLTQSQADLIKQSNVKLQEEIARTSQQVVDATALNTDLVEDLSRSRDTTKALQIKTSAKTEELEKELVVVKAEVVTANIALTAAKTEITSLNETIALAKTESERTSRLAFEHKVHLETRLQQKTSDLQYAEEQRTKDAKETLAREYQLSRSLNDTKRQLADVQSMYENDKRKYFELMATLKSENEQLNVRVQTLDKSQRQREQEFMAVAERLRSELGMSREELDEQRTSSKARENALDTTIQKLCADLRSAQSEINSMADRDVVHHRERLETVVGLNAKNGALQLHITRLEDELEAVKERVRVLIVEHAAERDLLKAQKSSQSSEFVAKLEKRGHENLTLAAANHQSASRVASLEEELSLLTAKLQRSNNVLTAENASQKVEIDGYKAAVSKLELHIENNYEIKLLREQNSDILEQLNLMKQRLANANTAFANLRVEVDISDNYRTALLQEKVEMQSKRAAILEKERYAMRPLLDVLLDVVQAKGYSDPGLDRDIEVFLRQFGPGQQKKITA